MKHDKLLALLRRRRVREDILSALGPSDAAANSVPASGPKSSKNSQGSVHQVRQVTELLNKAVRDIDFEDDVESTIQNFETRLADACKWYENYSLSEDSLEELLWNITQADSELIDIAWECAENAYKDNEEVGLANHKVTEVGRIKQSPSGSKKATVMTFIETLSGTTALDAELPVLVVAIRGSRGMSDWMVDLNNTPQSADHFLPPNFEAHGGFVAAAEALKTEISQCIVYACRTNPVEHVLFTGHSAGAAVASLLLLHYQTYGIVGIDGSVIRLSCIAFGSPPVLSPTVPEALESFSGSQRWLNIITEYDMVTRMDEPYIRSIAELLERADAEPQVPVEKDRQGGQGVRDGQTRWKIPQHKFRQCGDIIILHSESNDDGKPWDEGILTISALKIGWAEFSELLFPRVTVHARSEYRKKIEQLKAGSFG